MSVQSQPPAEPLTWPKLDECYLLTTEALAVQRVLCMGMIM